MISLRNQVEAAQNNKDQIADLQAKLRISHYDSLQEDQMR